MFVECWKVKENSDKLKTLKQGGRNSTLETSVWMPIGRLSHFKVGEIYESTGDDSFEEIVEFWPGA